MCAALSLLGTSHAAAQEPNVVRARVAMRTGDRPLGPGTSPVLLLSSVYTNGRGQGGFLVTLESGRLLLWVDRYGPAYTGQRVQLVSADRRIGVGDAGRFLVSGYAAGSSVLLSHRGVVMAEDDPAPGIPGASITQVLQPKMLPGGASYWRADYRFDSQKDVQSDTGRALYFSPDATAAGAQVLLRAGDPIVDGVVHKQGIGADYAVSDDGTHRILVLRLEAEPPNNRVVVVVDNVDVTQPGRAVRNVSINDRGDYLTSGSDGTDVSRDAFVAYNGAVAVREGSRVSGYALSAPALARGVSINNDGEALHLWTTADGMQAVLFFAYDASDLAGTSVPLIREGDLLDVDDDGLGEVRVHDIPQPTFGAPFSLAEDGAAYVFVVAEEGGETFDAVVRIATATASPSFCSAVDGALALCPCGAGADATGCATPMRPALGGLGGGVKLDVVDRTSTPSNRAVLVGSGYPRETRPTSLVLRSSVLEPVPLRFGDGLRCVGATGVTLLGAATAAGGVSTHEVGHDASQGSGLFHYQLWFRSTPRSFCEAGAAFNLSNGRSIAW